MLVLKIFCYMIVIILAGYSLIRYYLLWKRTRIPNALYFVFQALLLGTLYICSRKATLISNEIVRELLQMVSVVYLSVLVYTPAFCLIREGIRKLGKKKEKKGKVYRFFNHPARSIYAILGLTAAIGVFSFVNMRYIQVNEYSVVSKKEAREPEFTIAFISDLHVGSGVTRQGVNQVVKKANAMNADIIILGGDFFDTNTTDSMKQYTLEKLKELSAEYGVFFVEGDHELKQKEAFTDQFTEAGITVLQDQATFLVNGIQLVGLRDPIDKKKQSLDFIMNSMDKEKPIVVVSHRPKQLAELSEYGVDVVLSGHTHGGQYPFGGLVNRVSNDMIYGQKKYGTMTAITTSGAGGYGIPSKVTVPSEIVKVKISFATKNE